MNQRYNLGLYANCPICQQEMKIYWTDHSLDNDGSAGSGLQSGSESHFQHEAMGIYATAAASADAASDCQC
jgi:hypothetical protein